MILNTVGWLKIDFSSLRSPCYEYKKQPCSHRVEMALTAMVHFCMDPGKLVHWLGGEYVGDCCDVACILATVHGHVSKDDYAHMKRILIDSCHAELKFDKPLSNKLIMIEQGNSIIFNDNPMLILKIMNKEECYSYLLPLHQLICKFLL